MEDKTKLERRFMSLSRSKKSRKGNKNCSDWGTIETVLGYRSNATIKGFVSEKKVNI